MCGSVVETLLAFGFALAVTVGMNTLVAPEIEARKAPTSVEEELAFYPSGKLLKPATCGFQNVVADLLWLRAIQYYGEHRKTDLVFDKVAHVFNVLTDLDPHFVEAYRFGALVVIQDARDPAAGYALLRKGIRENPRSWLLPYDLGMHHFIAKEYGPAAAYFRRAGNFAGENELVARFTAYAEKKRGGFDEAEELWAEILETTENEKFREAALFALKGIQAARDTTSLAAAAREFRARAGRYPRAPEEIVAAGLIGEVPDEPYGERYIIQPATGEVRSAYLLVREVKRDRMILQAAVDRFHQSRGRYPVHLKELVAAGLVEEIPSPWGITYGVDRGTGSVEAAGPGAGGEARGGEES